MRILNKRSGMITALGVGLGLAITAIAYAVPTFGPSRPTFTWANPAHYITFNSITDNPIWGDERYVVKARDVNAGSSTYSNNVPVTDGEELLVTTYFHNNAASNLNLVANNVRVKVALPNGSATDQSIRSDISADNSNPTDVWATMDMTMSDSFTLEYVPGSAQLKTNAGIFPLSDNIVSSGVLVGSNGPDGKVPGCQEFSGYAYFHVRVHKKVTPPSPQYSCNLLTLTQDSSDIHKYNASVTYTAQNGATLSDVMFNWGDGTVNDKGLVTTDSHTFAKDGSYTVKATLAFDVNGQKVSGVTSENCSKNITITTPPTTPPQTPPTQLPNTGAGSVVGIFAGVSALAGAAHYILSGRRNVRE